MATQCTSMGMWDLSLNQFQHRRVAKSLFRAVSLLGQVTTNPPATYSFVTFNSAKWAIVPGPTQSAIGFLMLTLPMLVCLFWSVEASY